MMTGLITSRLGRRVLWTATILGITGLILQEAGRHPMELYEKRIISGNIEDVWRIATDVDRWSEWDPHEEAAQIYGPFEVGTEAYSKPRGGPAAHWRLTEVSNGESWSLVNPMRIGTLKVHNRYTEMPDGRVLCEKTMQVSGWILKTLFKLHFEKETRMDMHATWIALEQYMVPQTADGAADASVGQGI